MASKATLEPQEAVIPVQKDPDVLAAAARLAGEDLCSIADLSSSEAVSYTHLDVYKRQG